MAARKVAILLGKTGVGKSSLGNTLVGSVQFATGSSMTPVTTLRSTLKAPSACGKWTICDSVGLRDPNVTRQQAADSIHATVRDVREIHVLFYVFQFGRITDAELEDFLYLVNDVFGVDCLKNMYVVFTKCDTEALVEDRASRTPYLAGQAASSPVFGQIWRMLNQNADRFLFVDNPDPASTSSPVRRAAHAAAAAAARTAVGAVIDGWMSTTYSCATMDAIAQRAAAEERQRRAEEERRREEERVAAETAARLRAEEARREQERQQELARLQTEHAAEAARQQRTHMFGHHRFGPDNNLPCDLRSAFQGHAPAKPLTFAFSGVYEQAICVYDAATGAKIAEAGNYARSRAPAGIAAGREIVITGWRKTSGPDYRVPWGQCLRYRQMGSDACWNDDGAGDPRNLVCSL